MPRVKGMGLFDHPVTAGYGGCSTAWEYPRRQPKLRSHQKLCLFGRKEDLGGSVTAATLQGCLRPRWTELVGE